MRSYFNLLTVASDAPLYTVTDVRTAEHERQFNNALHGTAYAIIAPYSSSVELPGLLSARISDDAVGVGGIWRIFCVSGGSAGPRCKRVGGRRCDKAYFRIICVSPVNALQQLRSMPGTRQATQSPSLQSELWS